MPETIAQDMLGVTISKKGEGENEKRICICDSRGTGDSGCLFESQAEYLVFIAVHSEGEGGAELFNREAGKPK